MEDLALLPKNKLARVKGEVYKNSRGKKVRHDGSIACITIGCTTQAQNGTGKCRSCQKRKPGMDNIPKLPKNNSEREKGKIYKTHSWTLVYWDGNRANPVCTEEGCTRQAKAGTGKCVHHGGGKRCDVEGCTKGAVGTTGKCTVHGGGKRCTVEGCTNAAAHPSPDKCVAHGGGNRCNVEGCKNSAVDVLSGMCQSHGGGNRCDVKGCTNGAEGPSLDKCIRHGGGQRCKGFGRETHARCVEIYGVAPLAKFKKDDGQLLCAKCYHTSNGGRDRIVHYVNENGMATSKKIKLAP